MGATIQEIGYAFLQTYYHRMNKDPSKVSCLYSATAELTHTNYQVDVTPNSDTLPTVKLTGKENISKFFTRNNKKVSDLKVKIESCDFQTTGLSHSGILILITGEMFWTGTPTYRFVQSIILTPSSYKDAFDVTNDVIRFINDDLILEKIREESVEESEKKRESNHEQERQEINGGSEKTDEEPKSEDKKTKESQEESKESRSQSKESSKENSQGNVSHQSTQPQQQSVRISWASKIAANGDSSSKTGTNELQYNGATAVKRIADGKPDLSTRKEIANRTDKNDRTTNKKKTLFSTVNKDGYYPIYIKGTAGIREDRLKETLEAEFGTVMKITNSDNFAVVDFESQRSQMDALDRKQLTVDDTEVLMCRKTVKKSPSPPVGNAQTNLRTHKKHSGKKRE